MKQLRDSKAQGSALFTLVSGIVIVIAVIYFVLTFTVTRILRFIERRMDMDTYTTGANQMQTEDLK